MADDLRKIDLALLTSDDMKDIARRKDIPGYSGVRTRADLVRLLREHDIGLPGGQQRSGETSENLSSLVKELRHTVEVLAKGMTAMQDEVKTLKEELSHQRSAAQNHPSAQTGPLPESVNPQRKSSQTYSDRVRAGAPASTSATSGTSTTSMANTQTRATSYYHKPPPPKQSTLRSAVRLRCRALYVGNIHTGCEAQTIENWCKAKKIEIIKCSVSETRRGAAFAHVVVPEKDLETVLSDGFWPDNVHPREWQFKTDRITANNQ